MPKEFEFKIPILGWLKRRKAAKRKLERESLARSRRIYRGQALKLQGRRNETLRS